MKKMVIVSQHDAKDCGACCLQSIIRYYGGYVPVEKIRDDTYTTVKGTSVYHLVEAAKSYGFDAVAKKYVNKDLNSVMTPAIVHVKYPNGLLHFMVLYSYGKKVIVMDPAKGKVTLTLNEFNEIFSGVVIELAVKSPIMLLEKETSIYQLFFKILLTNKALCIRVFLYTLILMILTITLGMYFKVIYEMIMNHYDVSIIKWAIYLFCIIVIAKIVVSYIKSSYENYINKNIDVNVLSNFITHTFRLPLKVIGDRSTGEIITRVNEISNIKDLFSEIFVSCTLNLILSIGSLVCLFYIDMRLCLVLCLIILIYIILSLVTNSYIYKRIKQNINFQTIVNAKLIERLDMIHSIKNLDRTDKVLNDLEKDICNLLYDHFSFSKFIVMLNSLKNSIDEIGQFIINTLGLYFIYTGKLQIISLITFNTIMMYFTDPIKNIMAILPKFNFLRASFRKISEFIDLDEEVMGKTEKFVNDDITFQDVSFSYDKNINILDNLSFTIKKGEKIMLKGPSGSGKSTICNLLQRNINPDEGKILIGKKNLLDYSLKTVKNNICYVGQKEKIFSDTIKQNILFYNDLNDTFDKVCEVCAIEDIVKNKRFRYDSGIDNDSNLSGGEKQRIILARSLLSDSNILVLDEALSETDYELEKQIINSIKKTFPYKTLIYVSHKNLDDMFERVIDISAT